MCLCQYILHFCVIFAHGVSRSRGSAYNSNKDNNRKEGTPMKIVILRTPPLIAPILRRMFGIRKEKKR